MHRAWWAALLACLIAFACPANAGQVRVDLNSLSFSPNDVTVNVGDHVVWVWVTGAHTVTSGNVVGGTGVADGRFASSGSPLGTLSGAGTQYTWKSTSPTGNQNYYCAPHASMGMTGVVRIVASGAAVADFRITEVQFGAAGGLDRIEITNLGDAVGDLGRYRISLSGVGTEADIVPVSTLSVPIGGRVTIHTNETGTNTATHLYMSGIGDLGSPSGSVALFAPYRVSTSPGPLTSNYLVDFVQWGASARPNSDVAETASLWNAAEFVAGEPLPAYSISFCGTRTQRGAAFWNVTTANFGTSGLCTTDALNTSWGRIKTLYR